MKDSLIQEIADELHYQLVANDHSDLSDIGNNVGIVLGKYIDDKEGFELSDLLSGIEHGISLIDGTH